MKLLFEVDTKLLDYHSEMRKLFGSRVVLEAAQEQRNNNARRQPRSQQMKRQLLAAPNDTWPRLVKNGLNMEVLEKKADDGNCGFVGGFTTEFSFQHSKAYQDVQRMFLECIKTHGPNTIAHVLHMYPYHIDSLLQLSEVSRINGDANMSAELVGK